MNFRGISGALNRLVNKEGGTLERGAEGPWEWGQAAGYVVRYFSIPEGDNF